MMLKQRDAVKIFISTTLGKKYIDLITFFLEHNFGQFNKGNLIIINDITTATNLDTIRREIMNSRKITPTDISLSIQK